MVGSSDALPPRRRGSGSPRSSGSGGDFPGTDIGIDSLLSDLRGEWSAIIESQIRGLEDRVIGRTATLIKAYDGQVQAQVGEQSEHCTQPNGRGA